MMRLTDFEINWHQQAARFIAMSVTVLVHSLLGILHLHHAPKCSLSERSHDLVAALDHVTGVVDQVTVSIISHGWSSLENEQKFSLKIKFKRSI
jgi:hypothetical protein